ncbi:hypothetical protein CONPUDRAFT_141631 [Coniophora puteana RWD-64-598 SS2]|uniref:Uncharacterized protein n=1 Tax=Coniophora puteana (strain RWD-64-598) TaxID=741705 RepID=A0A5M3N1G9_CONPW|nr:uncharacterized protein CONPUDRAFT_141631 [Coniophora puteana RWD-64-598 SS2]EIW84745.1 hypothetical protein CONPUDRAFT_141631 [Coniophora puteana RWD-64-598 SS2]
MSGSPSLAGRLMPRRSAATKASASFADQLSSPGSSSPSARSDDSFGGSGGERHAPSVKVRYGGKHKYHASPLKVTSTSSAEQSPTRKPRPTPKPKPVGKRAGRSGQSQKKRRRSRSRSREPASSLSSSPSPSTPKAHATKKARVEKPKLSPLDTAALSAPLPSKNEGEGEGEGSPLTEPDSPLTPVSGSPAVATSPISPGYASPPPFMKSLSQASASASASAKKAVSTPSAKNGAKRKLTRPHTISKAPPGSAKTLAEMVHTHTHTNGKGKGKDKGRSAYTEELGSFVFVLVGENGKVAAGERDGASGKGQRDVSVQIIESVTWWPARVSRMRSETSGALQVRLFGDNTPGSSSLSSSTTPSSSFPLASSSSLLPIESPSPANVRPMRTPSGELSFTDSTCRYTSGATKGDDGPPDPTSSSPGHEPPPRPKKRPKSAWQAAVDKMVEAEEQDKDGMPAFISSFRLDSDLDEDLDEDGDLADGDGNGKHAPASSGKDKVTKGTKGTSKRVFVDLLDVDDDDDDVDMDFGDDDDDDDLDYLSVRVGDFVLSWYPRTCEAYWPAKVIGIQEPVREPGGAKGKAKGRRKGRMYELEFMDGVRKALPKKKFFTNDEKGFVTCKVKRAVILGEWTSKVKDVDGPDDDDDANDSAKPPPFSSFSPSSSDPSQQRPRSPSPAPVLPPPAKEAFADLPLRTQLAYVKPVLLATLRGAYAPALARHRAFMKGGAARAGIQKDAGVRGEMGTTDVAELRALISEWVLRGETRGRPGVGEDVEENEGGQGVGVDVVPMDVDRRGPEVGEEGENVDVTNGNGHVEAPGPGTGEACPDTNHPLAIGGTDSSALTSAKPSDASHQPDGEAQQGGNAIGQTSSQNDPYETVEVGAVPSGAPGLPRERETEADALSQGRAGAEAQHKVPIEVEAKTVVKEGAGHADEERGDATAEASQAISRKPFGCEEYESLAGHEKVAYCTDVLLREAVQQLHLWRAGDRTSVDLLPEAEEARLHAIAVGKMEYRDWVWDVVRMRKAQARLHSKREEPKNAAAAASASGGTRSRPRTSTVSRR